MQTRSHNTRVRPEQLVARYEYVICDQMQDVKLLLPAPVLALFILLLGGCLLLVRLFISRTTGVNFQRSTHRLSTHRMSPCDRNPTYVDSRGFPQQGRYTHASGFASSARDAGCTPAPLPIQLLMGGVARFPKRSQLDHHEGVHPYAFSCICMTGCF